MELEETKLLNKQENGAENSGLRVIACSHIMDGSLHYKIWSSCFEAAQALTELAEIVRQQCVEKPQSTEILTWAAGTLGKLAPIIDTLNRMSEAPQPLRAIKSGYFEEGEFKEYQD